MTTGAQKSGLFLGVVGGAANLGLFGYALYSFLKGRHKQGVVALGGIAAIVLASRAVVKPLLLSSQPGGQP